MIKSLFEGVKNVKYVGEAEYDIVGQNVKMKTVVLEELYKDRWNSLAERTNTASFIRMTGKQPKDYAEVQEWVKSLTSGKEKSRRGNDSFTISVG
ncbi:hypothetical protein ACIQZG_20970 [Lysinibacillus sp. NPDC096418]|uniref:hypothetical protein n=1 Tax=Lysinibacillus sp. NPDC096418 TaxID=3364138 RepID=UPI00380DCAE1